ncbi:MAG: crossover junction endodeoxyribonuclease RuvC [Clostridia bacterium]|nr:crossover junction endodeoxyribonuclease RuvC [Clostridia bacterium]
MIILGIDPGLAIVGYGVLESVKGKVTPIDYGVINTPAGMATPLRLQRIHKGMMTLLEKYKPDEIAVEELFFSNNVTTGIPVAEARGVILMTAINYTDKLFEYTPNQIKQAITGWGGADKHQMQEVVRQTLRLKAIPKPDDAADALAVALTHAQTNRFGSLFGM